MWDLQTPGVLELPSGRVVRGRSLREPIPDGPLPQFGIYLQGRDPGEFGWESEWIRWPDFWLPSDRHRFEAVLRQALRRSAVERVEIACTGGVGRTGTALACLVALDGMPGRAAVDYVRCSYSHRAVETPWQKSFAAHFVESGSAL